MPHISSRRPRLASRRLRPLVFPLALLAGAVAADGLDRGQQGLYENHCGKCHEASVHHRENRRADSREELRGWVSAWSVHTGLDWSAEDIESVTSYLS